MLSESDAGTLFVHKHTILVDKPGGELLATAAGLADHGFVIDPAHTVAEAFQKLESSDMTVLLLVHGETFGAAGAELVSEAKQRYPGLSVIWLERNRLATVSFRGEAPDALLRRKPTAASVAGLASGLLHEFMWPQVLVDSLCTHATTALEAFKSPTLAGLPCLKVRRNVLGEMSSMIGFSGSHVSGYVLVSSSRECFAGLCRRALPDPGEISLSQIADFAGEISNHMVRAVKELCQRSGQSVAATLPLLIDGDDVTLQPTRRPSIALTLDTYEGEVFIELWFDHFNLAAAAPDAKSRILASGEVTFL